MSYFLTFSPVQSFFQLGKSIIQYPLFCSFCLENRNLQIHRKVGLRPFFPVIFWSVSVLKIILLLHGLATYMCDGVSVLDPLWFMTPLALVRRFSTKSSRARETMTGTAAATLPTSSSLCIIFFIRA